MTHEADVRWSDGAAQRLARAQLRHVDGIDNPATTDFDTVKNDSALKF